MKSKNCLYSSRAPPVSWWGRVAHLFSIFVLSYSVFLRSEFHFVMPVTISAYIRCSVRLYLQLFVLVSYLRWLCLVAHNGVQHILYCVFVCLRPEYPVLPVSPDCLFLIASSVFSNICLSLNWIVRQARPFQWIILLQHNFFLNFI